MKLLTSERAPEKTRLTDIERQRKLSTEIDALVGLGESRTRGRWRVESRSTYEAVLVRDRKVHHKLHLVLTFLTVGEWAIVWMVLTAHAEHPKRKVISV